MVEEDTKTIENKTGIKLFCKYWKPKLDEGQNPRALVFLAHGYAEHILWFDPLSKSLAEKGIFVFGHDMIGHGQSEGPRILITNLNDCVADVMQHVAIVKEQYQDVPIFIVGYSMGGTITLKAVLEKPDLFKGMALIGPAIVIDPNEATPFRRMMARGIGRIFPSLPIAAMDANAMSTDKSVVKRYLDDPLVYHSRMKAGLAVAFLDLIDDVSSKLQMISCPCLIVHGTEDKLTQPSGSKHFMEKASSSDKTLSLYENCRHLLHHEGNGNGEKCVKEITDWIQTRI